MDKRYFSDKLVKWYDRNKRDLPWRETSDPYKIWLSEIILQQTRVSQGLPYYLNFIEKFPTVVALASASEQEVLRLWQGLGYYTRARNLHQCAREVVRDHAAAFPVTFESLKELRGIGDYTAAAIASIAFHEKVAVVDGNVFRVLSRVFGIETAINSPDGKKIFTALANELIGRARPERYNQAIMEFGALFCTPKNPDCPNCIFRTGCFAAKNNMQHLLPVKVKAKAARKRYFYYFVFRKGKSVGMKRRAEKDIWRGLFDFYLVEESKPVSLPQLVSRSKSDLPIRIIEKEVTVSGIYKHVLSHQIIFTRFIVVPMKSTAGLSKSDLKFYSAKKIADLPKPVLISRFLDDHHLL